MLDEVMARIAARFTRVEPRRTAKAFLLGLLSGIERKNCWWLAEHAGHRGPQAMQRLLREAVWDADALRDDVRELVVQTLGRPDGVLIADETGVLKKGRALGRCATPVHRNGRAYRNSQVAVFLAYASTAGRALIDRRIYLPASWSEDPDRRAAASPTDVQFATKPRLGLDMITAAVAAVVPARWVTGDEVYGNDPAFRGGVRTLAWATFWLWRAITGSPSTAGLPGCVPIRSPPDCLLRRGSATAPGSARKACVGMTGPGSKPPPTPSPARRW